MLVKLTALLAVVGVCGVQAQAQVYECNRYTRPNYDACDRIEAAVDWTEGPSTIHKRQEEVTVLGVSREVPKPGVRNRMTGFFLPGEATSWTTTEGYSVSVSVSAGVSASFFERFTASVNINVPMEYSQSYNKSIEFDPSQRCTSTQTAFMVFMPYFDHYVVMDENKQQYDIWIPLADQGEFGVQCLG